MEVWKNVGSMLKEKSMVYGSKAIGRAIAYLAKIQLLPTEHPTARMVLASVPTVSETWVSSVKELMSTFPVSSLYVVMQSGARFSKQNTKRMWFFLHYAPGMAQLASLCLDLGLPIMIWSLSVQLRGGISYFRC